ncbi:MAG: AIM24 family protein [Acidobacteria bacterium]|nr:MAG: AIM24 family protein [Acidobacteriota bacterium]REK07820.1 MAG: AIM24 family protein [Acidobacteriota bacterium]
MSRYSLDEFVQRTAQKDRGQGLFELEGDRALEINLADSQVWAKLGAMIAYHGAIRFEREKMLEHGVGKMLKRSFTGEGTRLMKATGKGKLYLADSGKKITILEMAGETLFVNGNDLLAFEPSIAWDIKMMRKVAAMLSGGLFNVRLEGSGLVAITSHYDPLTLAVTPQRPVMTDPNATVAWSGNLSPEFRTDVTLRTFLGRGSGESIQMEFRGEGFVVVQPFEEVVLQQPSR